ncbi:MAG: septal ring lytic transglycosylase RlpA family protein [Symbiobacteriia bacterium]
MSRRWLLAAAVLSLALLLAAGLTVAGGATGSLPPKTAPAPRPVSIASLQPNERERTPSSLASRGLPAGRVVNVSWYGVEFQDLETASGEPFDRYRLTAAHRTLPFGTILRLTNGSSGRTVEVRVNDRGPWVAGRDLDLSEAAFKELAPLGAGVIAVHVETIPR